MHNKETILVQVERLPVYWKQRRMMFFDAFSFAFPAALQRIPYSLFVSLIWTVVTYFPVGLSAEPSRCALVPSYATLCCAVLCTLCCAVLSFACCVASALCCLLHAVLLCAALCCAPMCHAPQCQVCIRLDSLKMQIATFQDPSVYITCDFVWRKAFSRGFGEP